MVYALQKFRHYLLGAHFKICTDHYALRYLVNKCVVGGGRGMCRWFLIFQEYDFEVIVKPEILNIGPYHLSTIDNGEEPTNIDEGLHDAQLFTVKVVNEHFANIIQFLSTGIAPDSYTTQ